MSERREPAPDVQALLRLLREKAAQAPEGPEMQEVRGTDWVRQISQQAAAAVGVDRLRPDVPSLFEVLRHQVITSGRTGVQFQDVGTVQHVGSGVVTLSGLPQVGTNELVAFSTGAQGVVLNLERRSLDVILLGSSEGIQGGDLVRATGQRLQIPVGRGVLGRVLDPLARPLDDRAPIEGTEMWHLERPAPGIVERAPVSQPLLTGWKVIDALVPIGRGQRELILGDRQTGKTTLVVDVILNQRDQGVLCFYVAIGQKKSTTLAVIETLQRYGAMSYTTVVIAGADDPPALRYLAPYAGCSMAEFFVREGRDVLIVYDDLTKHADAYRELSLLLRRPPGREAYPGDIFYLHSRLLERACKLNENVGGGSLTALPIAETQQGNISAYIPTNLISITDGQIILDTDLFNQGLKPAVDVSRSVSRVGGAAQVASMRRVAANLRLELSQYEEVRRFAQFGTDVDEATRQQIRRGERWQRVLIQPPHQPLSLAQELLILRAASEGYLDDIPTQDIGAFEKAFLDYVVTTHQSLTLQIDRGGDIFDALDESFREAIEAFRETWLSKGGRA